MPWTVDAESSDVLKFFTGLKCRLMPYLYSQAMLSTISGLPVSLRAMFIEFPDDPTSYYLDRQFMFGDSILIAPVFAESGEVEFYLPKGRWTNFLTGEKVDGPCWRKETHGFLSIPRYVREGSWLVLGQKGEKRCVYDWTDGVEVRAYPPAGDKWDLSTKLYDEQGVELGLVTILKSPMLDAQSFPAKNGAKPKSKAEIKWTIT